MKVKQLNFIFVLIISMLMFAGAADARVYEYFDSQGNKYREMERAIPGYAGSRYTILRDTYFDTVTGDKKNETRYEYNDSGKQTQINSFTYKKDDSGTLQEIRQNEQEYDPETGNRIRLTYFDSNTNTKSYEYRYRTDNQQLSYTRFDTATGDKTSETRYEYNSEGKRTQINSFTYAKDASGNLQEIRQNEQEYDPATGNRTRLTYFDLNTNTKSYEYLYRPDNQQLSYTRFDTVTGDKTSETRYVYNSDGKRTELNQYVYEKDSSGNLQEYIQSITEYYPDTGNQKRRVQYNTSTNQKTYEYTYDSSGRMTGYMRYDTAGSMIYKDERTYGDDGKIKEIKEYGLNESGEFVVDKISSYEYYPNGNSRSTVQVKMIGTEAKTISEINYYENGRTQSQTYYDQSTGAKTYDYAYDENGRQTSYQRYASDGVTVTNRYEYTYNGDGKQTELKQFVYEAGELRIKSVTLNEYQANGSYAKIETFSYNYDENGNQIGDRVQTGLTTYHEGTTRIKDRVYFDAATGNKTYMYSYDSSGRTLLYETYARDGITIKSKTTYAYNESGQTTEVTSYSYDLTTETLIPSSQTLYSYNAAGKTASIKNYRYNSSEGELVFYSESAYSYFDNGRTESVISYAVNASGQTVTTGETYYYDTGRTRSSVSYNTSTGMKTYEAEYYETGRTKRTAYFNSSTGKKTSENYYNENGQTTGSAGFDADGNMISKTEYTYDENGRVKLVMTSSVEGSAVTPTQSTAYEYHPNGQNKSVISNKILSDGSTQLLSRTDYNNEGRTILQESYNASTGKISYRYTYADSGQVLAYTRYDSDGNENYSTEYSYDNQNRMTEQAVKSVVSGVYQTTQRTVYAYFPNDNYYEIKTFSVKQDGSEVLTYHREYFDTGRTKMQVTFDSTTGNQSYKYEYNYNGSMRYYERYGTDGTAVIARNDYVYDSLGRQIQLNEKTLVGDELKLTYRTDQTYYSNDRVKEIKRYRIEADGTETLIQHTSYHATGRVEMQTTFDQNTGKIASRYTYDENGRQLMYQRYASDGTTVIDQREYSYNGDGKLTGEIRSVYEAGQLRTKYVTNYEYQSNGSYSKIESFTYNYNENGEQVGDPIRTGLTVYHEGSNRVKERIYYDESTGNQTRKYVYDADGRTTLYEQYAKDGQTVQARTVYSYNESGQTLEVQNYTYSSDSETLILTSKTVYEYFSNGRTQFVRSYSLNSSGDEVLTSEIEYYDTGRTKRSTSFNSSTGNKTYEYYYDENGRYQGNAYFDADGNIRSKSEYVYDQDGRTSEIINSSVVDGELTVTQKTKYTYYSNGRNRQIISVKVLADGTEQLLSKTEYNSDGRTVLQESYNSSTGLISYRYTYDDSGRQTGYVRYDSEGNENYSVSYTYNESGQVTEQVVKSVSGGVYAVTQRTVYNYYPNDKYYEVKTFSVKPDGSEVLTQHNEYFDTGRTKMQTVFNSTTGIRSYKYEYNYNGSTNFYERYEADGVTVNFRQDYDYDNLNRLIRLSEKSLVDGVLALTYITDRTYHSNDQLKDTRRYKVLSDGSLMLVQLVEYQSGGRIQQQVIYSESNGSMQTRYLYDENGRQVSYERFDSDGNALSKQTYAYNANGQRTAVAYYTLVDGILTETSRNEYEYNADGQLTKQSEYSMVGGELKLTSWTEYKYDGNYYSEIISYKQNYDSVGNPAGDPVKLSVTVYYPGSNQVKERVYYREDGSKSASSSYNLSGQLTQSEQFDSTGTKTVSKTDYEYDASGHQTRKTTHSLVDDVLVPTSQTRYAYNEEGKQTLVEQYSRIGNRLRKTSWTVYEYSGSYYSKIQTFIQNYDSDGNSLGDPITTSLTTYHDGSNTVKDRTYFTNQGIKTYRYTYNTSGRNVMYERFDSTGENVINRTEYEYDDRGRTIRVSNSALVNGELKIVSWSENTYDGDYPTVSESFVQHYDDAGNATETVKTNQTLYHPNSSTVRERSYYNSANGVINRKYEYTTDSLLDTDTSYDSAGNPSSQRKHHYDQNKRLIRIEDFIFDQTGTKVKVGETRYEYASNGRYSKVSTFRMIDGELVLSASTEYEYDSNGRQTKVTNSAVVDGEFRKTNETTYEYDENGRIQRQQNFQFIKDSEGNLIRKLQSEYLYDSLTGTLSKYKIYNVLTGTLVKEYTYNSNGRLLENVTYDSNGNRVSEVFNTYTGNQLTKVETYTYYDGPDSSRIKKKTGEQIYNADTGHLEKDSRFTYDFDSDRRVEKETVKTVNYDSDGNQLSTTEGEVHYLYEGTVDGESVNTYYVSANYDKDNKLTAKSVTIKGPDNELILRVEHTIEDGEITGTKVFDENNEEITNPDRGLGSESGEMNAGDIMQVYWDMMSQRPGTGPATMPGGGGIGVGGGPAGIEFIGGANLPGAAGFGGQFSVKRPSAFTNTGSFGE